MHQEYLQGQGLTSCSVFIGLLYATTVPVGQWWMWQIWSVFISVAMNQRRKCLISLSKINQIKCLLWKTDLLDPDGSLYGSISSCCFRHWSLENTDNICFIIHTPSPILHRDWLPYVDEICTFIIMFRIVIMTLPSVSEGQLVLCTWIDRGALVNYLWEIFFL